MSAESAAQTPQLIFKCGFSGAEELYYEALGRMKPKPCMVTFHCSTESLYTVDFTDADDDSESR